MAGMRAANAPQRHNGRSPSGRRRVPRRPTSTPRSSLPSVSPFGFDFLIDVSALREPDVAAVFVVAVGPAAESDGYMPRWLATVVAGEVGSKLTADRVGLLERAFRLRRRGRLDKLEQPAVFVAVDFAVVAR